MNKNRRALKNSLGNFVRQYARRRQRNLDPNDRRYDRKLEEIVKRMDAAELDRLLRQDEEE